jgi:acyl-coenzyme A synthetase/AMP-(fatty) acid ligase
MIYIIGRKDDIINYGGVKISPHEIEDIVKSHEGVAESMLVPVEDDTFGHIPRLYIEVKDGFDMKDFRETLAEKIDASKQPAGIEIVKAFPLLPNGKLDRQRMVEIANGRS